MPNETDYTPDEVSKPGTYHLQGREQGNNQASVTFKVSSVGKKPLGRGGEQFGIAKRNVMDLYQPILEQRRQLDQEQNLDPNDRRRRGDLLDREKNRHEDTACTALNCLYLELPYPATQEHVAKSNLQSRAVASSKVDELLGMQILAQEKFGLDDDGKVIGISVGVDGVSATGSLPQGGSYVLDIDYSDPQIQRGLSDLEALDYITGQVDRHAGNIFIDPVTKQVRGIDNDLAFPGIPRENLVASNDPTVSTKLVMNKPQFLHEETARRIERLTPEELRKTLSGVGHPGGGNRGKLTEAEIDGAVTRLTELQTEIVEMRKEGRVVSSFNQKTYDRAIESQNKVSLEKVQRELDKQQNSVMFRNKEVPEVNIRGTKLHGWESSQKTSYLGTMHVQKMKAGLADPPVLSLKPDAFEERGITSKIPRSPQAEEFQRLSAPIKQGYEAQHREKNMEQYMKLEKQIMEYKDRLDDLQRSGPTVAKFKSLRYGGVDKAIEAFNKKLGDASAKLMDLNLDCEKQVTARMDVVSERLWDKAVANVPYVERQEMNQGQGVQNPQAQVQVQRQEQQVELEEIPDNLGDNHIMREVDNKPKVDLNALRGVDLEELDVEEDLDEGVELDQSQELVQSSTSNRIEELENFSELEELSELDNELEELVENDLEELSVDEPSKDLRTTTTVKDELSKLNRKDLRSSQKLGNKDDDHSVATVMGYDRNKKTSQKTEGVGKLSHFN